MAGYDLRRSKAFVKISYSKPDGSPVIGAYADSGPGGMGTFFAELKRRQMFRVARP